MEKLSETIPENYVAKMFGLDRTMYYHAMLGVAKVRETKTPKTYFELMLKFEGYDLSKIKESTINDLEAHLSPEKFEMVMDMLNSNLTAKID